MNDLTGTSTQSELLNFENGLSLELRSYGGFFQGIGAVTVDGQALRSGRRPWGPEIRTPTGHELGLFRVETQEATPQGAKLKFSMSSWPAGPMEWMVHEVRPRWNTSDWTQGPQLEPDSALYLALEPVRRTIGGKEYRGLRYSYRYQSQRHPIYKLLDRGTWEPGGHALGCEFWMRNCFVPSRVRFDAMEQFHSTEWYLPDCQNPTPVQFLPLQTELQGFTFTSGAAGILVTWATQAAHVRSLFEKKRGVDEIEHWHEHCGDLSHEFATSPVEVLFAPGACSEVDCFNAYEAVRELVHETLHSQVGMRRERVLSYGQIEEWGPANLERYRQLGLPKLLAAGARTVYLGNHFENNMNTWGVSNMCCTVDLKVAGSVGIEPLRAFCADARAGGAKVEMWGNTALSSLSPIFDARNGGDANAGAGRVQFLPQQNSVMDALRGADAPWVRNASNAIEADHYTPVFCVMNLRDDTVRRYWLQAWKAAHLDAGLEGIFLDSSFNLSSDKFHWVQNTLSAASGGTADQTHLLGHYRPAQEPPAAILSQYLAHLQLMVEMQREGYAYCNEDLGVFGVHRHGPGVAARLDTLPIWPDCIASFEPTAIAKAGGDADDVYFRGLAYRTMWSLFWNIGRDELSFNYGSEMRPGDAPEPWHLALYHVYNQVEEFMLERRIIAGVDGTEAGADGVLYRGGGRQVFWAFKECELPPSNARSWLDVSEGAGLPEEPLRARRHHVYLSLPPA